MNHRDKRFPADSKLTVHKVDNRTQVGPEDDPKIINAINDTGIGHCPEHDNHHNRDTGDNQLVESFFPNHPDIIPHHPLQNQHAKGDKNRQSDQSGCRCNLEKEVVQTT